MHTDHCILFSSGKRHQSTHFGSDQAFITSDVLIAGVQRAGAMQPHQSSCCFRLSKRLCPCAAKTSLSSFPTLQSCFGELCCSTCTVTWTIHHTRPADCSICLAGSPLQGSRLAVELQLSSKYHSPVRACMCTWLLSVSAACTCVTRFAVACNICTCLHFAVSPSPTECNAS